MAKQDTSAALATRRADIARGGTFREAGQIQNFLRDAAELCHLISPSTTAARGAESISVAFSAILITEADTYRAPSGGQALTKSALDLIAATAGISWDPVHTGRRDDGSDPHYCHYRAFGRIVDFDGSRRTLLGEKIMDLRDKSDFVQAIVEVCAAKVRKEELDAKRGLSEPGTPGAERLMAEARRRAAIQLRGAREHILGHAESKAKNRAIRSLGIRSSYTHAELQKPFIVARPIYTGWSSDPAERRENQAAIRESFLGGSSRIYGQAPALPAPGLAPPPVGTVHDRDEDAIDIPSEPADMDRESGEYEGERGPDAVEPPQDERPPPAEKPPSSGAVVPFGRSKGTPLSEAEGSDLEWLARTLRENVEDPQKDRWREKNEGDLADVERELSRRRGEDEPPLPDDGDRY